jgi:hypothetical protein
VIELEDPTGNGAGALVVGGSQRREYAPLVAFNLRVRSSNTPMSVRRRFSSGMSAGRTVRRWIAASPRRCCTGPAPVASASTACIKFLKGVFGRHAGSCLRPQLCGATRLGPAHDGAAALFRLLPPALDHLRDLLVLFVNPFCRKRFARARCRSGVSTVPSSCSFSGLSSVDIFCPLENVARGTPSG